MESWLLLGPGISFLWPCLGSGCKSDLRSYLVMYSISIQRHLAANKQNCWQFLSAIRLCNWRK